MQFFWQYGAMFVKDVVLLYDEPKPHFNTVSTMVRTLETKGFLDHEAFGNTYRYRPIISQEEFSKGVLGNVVSRYFENSYKRICKNKNGKIIFNGTAKFLNGGYMCVASNGVLTIGDDALIGSNYKIMCFESISIGRSLRCTYDCQIYDTSYHY